MISPQSVEREYNNRALVPDHPRFFARWERDSEFVRATLPAELDAAYGPHPRHRLDFFPAARARGTLLFIHGGYWRALDKGVFSWIAASYVAAGINVALANYRLVPEVRIDDIVDDALAATRAVLQRWPQPLVIAGHSAGGHLTAAVFATPRERLGFDPARVVGGVPFSGIYDFAPLLHFSFNADFRLDDAAVRRLALAGAARSVAAPLVVAVGGDESGEFIRQSRELAQAWAPQVRALHVLPGLHHFSIVDGFTERSQPLYEATLALFPGEAAR